MKIIRLIAYVVIFLVFLGIFNYAFTDFFRYLLIFYNEYVSDTFFWYIFKMFFFLPVIGIILYILHFIFGALSLFISRISTFKAVTFYVASILIAGNLLFWFYEIWFNSGIPYSFGLVVLNLIASSMIFDFSFVLYKGQIMDMTTKDEPTDIDVTKYTPMERVTKLTQRELHDYKIMWGQNLTEEELIIKANEIVDNYNSRIFPNGFN